MCWAQVRAVMQKKLCRPVPLEMIGSLTVATLRELAAEAGAKSGRPAAQAAPEEVRRAARATLNPTLLISLRRAQVKVRVLPKPIFLLSVACVAGCA